MPCYGVCQGNPGKNGVKGLSADVFPEEGMTDDIYPEPPATIMIKPRIPRGGGDCGNYGIALP